MQGARHGQETSMVFRVVCPHQLSMHKVQPQLSQSDRRADRCSAEALRTISAAMSAPDNHPDVRPEIKTAAHPLRAAGLTHPASSGRSRLYVRGTQQLTAPSARVVLKTIPIGRKAFQHVSQVDNAHIGVVVAVVAVGRPPQEQSSNPTAKERVRHRRDPAGTCLMLPPCAHVNSRLMVPKTDRLHGTQRVLGTTPPPQEVQCSALSIRVLFVD
ncbi:hypothetical protein PYCCODRAFT_862532 [Trametes coccinea BRFM310]|uniref:Uncharacterized protein n=1 Tax=Trametes coccinea (strain BRFM310) TaxID=1353009 RepID=A0A1Y2IDI7_TRAC3|nr:hypothetical protein PYCCODRAFT_862532 [Trametes coccinea BRFM310]